MGSYPRKRLPLEEGRGNGLGRPCSQPDSQLQEMVSKPKVTMRPELAGDKKYQEGPASRLFFVTLTNVEGGDGAA